MSGDQDARERMIQAAAELLSESSEVEKITVRQISERAGVGIGSIGYHFGSKDSLLAAAAGSMLSRMTEDFFKCAGEDSDPVQGLRDLMKVLFRFSGQQEAIVRFLLLQGIQRGELQAGLMLIPQLRRIFGEKKEEPELRILALQLIEPLQFAAVSPEAFRLYSGVDLFEEEARNRLIDMLVDNLITQGEGLYES